MSFDTKFAAPQLKIRKAKQKIIFINGGFKTFYS